MSAATGCFILVVSSKPL